MTQYFIQDALLLQTIVLAVQLIDEQAKWVKSRQDDFDYTLNYTDYLEQNEERDQKSKKFDRLKDFESVLSFKPLPDDLPLIQKDEVSKEKRVRWEESLGKDIYVDEAINVLGDLTKFKASKRSIAQKDYRPNGFYCVQWHRCTAQQKTIFYTRLA